MAIARRHMLGASLAGGALWALGCTARPRPRTSSAAGTASPQLHSPPARSLPDIPGLVAELRGASRDDLLPRIVRFIAGGLEPASLALALQLAAATDIVPRTRLGPDQHAHLLVHAAVLASQASEPHERWYPLLWAADFYKQSQIRAREYEPELIAPLPQSQLMPPEQAPAELARGMDTWDGKRVENALIALHRAGLHDQVEELAMRHAARDFRHIGHKVIMVANGLSVLGRASHPRAEPVLRSMAVALALHYEQEGRDFDSSWARNLSVLERAGGTAGWPAGETTGSLDAGATSQLLSVLRQGGQSEASAAFAAMLDRAISPRSLWDAVLCNAAELSMNHPDNVVALHAVTTANAAYACYRRCHRDDNRYIILLQSAARAVFFRHHATEYARDKSKPMTRARIEELVADRAPGPVDHDPRDAAGAILEEPGADPVTTARRTLALLARPGGERALLAQVRSQTVRKADNNHDFKLTSAFIQDLAHVTPAWRARYLAACIPEVKPARAPDSPVSERITQVLRGKAWSIEEVEP